MPERELEQIRLCPCGEYYVPKDGPNCKKCLEKENKGLRKQVKELEGTREYQRSELELARAKADQAEAKAATARAVALEEAAQIVDSHKHCCRAISYAIRALKTAEPAP